MVRNGAKSVASVYYFDKQMEHLRHIRDTGELVPVSPEFHEGAGELNVQRQDLERTYVLNGAVYAARAETLVDYEGFHGPETMALVMGREESVDIHTQADIHIAEALLRSNPEYQFGPSR